jgi:hypothetical protein
MWKKLVIGGATLAVLGLSSVWAQRAPDRPDRPNGPPFSREDAGAFLEARIAALHAGLQLTPAQEPLWPPFEQAYRDRGKMRIARAAAAPPPPAEDPIARLQRRADALLQQGAVLKRLADAAAPLWQSFDDGQKRRFGVLARPFYQRMMTGFGGGRPDERSGLGAGPGRDGGRFGLEGGPGGFGPRPGPGGRFGRDGDDGRGPRGAGPGFGPGIGPGAGPRLRFGGQPGRDGEDFGYGRGPRGPEGGFGREPRRDSGRDQDREFGRGQFRGRRDPAETGPGRQGRADGEEQR